MDDKIVKELEGISFNLMINFENLISNLEEKDLNLNRFKIKHFIQINSMMAYDFASYKIMSFEEIDKNSINNSFEMKKTTMCINTQDESQYCKEGQGTNLEDDNCYFVDQHYKMYISSFNEDEMIFELNDFTFEYLKELHSKDDAFLFDYCGESETLGRGKYNVDEDGNISLASFGVSDFEDVE